MTSTAMPGRASDAGPDTTASPINRQSLFSLLTDDVMEDARALGRCYHDGRVDEQRKRIELVRRLQETLAKVLEVV